MHRQLSIQRRSFCGIDAELLHGVGDALAVALSLFLKLVERGQRNALGVDFEMASQRAAAFASPHAVGAEDEEAAWDPFADLFRKRANVVGRGDAGTVDVFQSPLDVGNTR